MLERLCLGRPRTKTDNGRSHAKQSLFLQWKSSWDRWHFGGDSQILSLESFAEDQKGI